MRLSGPKEMSVREELYRKRDFLINKKGKWQFESTLLSSRLVEIYREYLTKFEWIFFSQVRYMKMVSAIFRFFPFQNKMDDQKSAMKYNIRMYTYISLYLRTVIRASEKKRYKYSQLSCQTHIIQLYR